MRTNFIYTTLLCMVLLTACDNKMKFQDQNQMKLTDPDSPIIVDPTPEPSPSPTPVVVVPTPTPVVVDPTPTPTPSPTPIVVVPTPTPTPTPSPTPVVVVPTPTPTPIPTPTPTPTPIPTPEPPKYAKTSGACAADSSTSLTSCMKCNVPMNPPAPPQFSQKARELIDLLTIGCAKNAAIYGYKAPTKAQLEKMLNRCSQELYPATAKSNAQANVVDKLVSGNEGMTDKFFGKHLYYQPPFTDAFETYFGIENKDIQGIFCRMNGSTSIPYVHSIEWYQAQYTDEWLTFKEKPAYVAAETYRGQLENCLKKSITNPYVPPTPTPAKKCEYETLSGLNGDAITAKLGEWLKAGYKIGIDVKNTGLCGDVTSADQYKNVQGDVLISAYICK